MLSLRNSALVTWMRQKLKHWVSSEERLSFK